MKRKAPIALEPSLADRADDKAPRHSDAVGDQVAAATPVTACQRFAEPPVPIPRAPFDLSAGLGGANVRAIRKGDLDLVRAGAGASVSLAPGLALLVDP